MHWILNPSLDPAFNLALEEILLRRMEPGHEGYGILWQNAPTVVVGRFQNARAEVNTEILHNRGIKLVRRLTGGGAVYHDAGTLNYTFIHHLSSPNERPAFCDVGKPIAEALIGLGLPVAFSGRNDLLLGSVKVAGVAHCRMENRLLHHGCLLISSDLDMLAQVLRPDLEKLRSKGLTSVRSRVTNLANHADVTVGMVRNAIARHCNARSRPLEPELLRQTEELAVSKYATHEWTLRPDIAFTERRTRRFPIGTVEVLLEIHDGVIADCRLYGDFFGDATPVENALRGIFHTRDNLKEVFATVAPERHIEGILREELLNLLLPTSDHA